MKALVLWEPWASLVACGAKTWETRSWSTTYRGPLLICASKGGLARTELEDVLRKPAFQRALQPLVKRTHPDPRRGPAIVGLEHLRPGMAVALVDLCDCRRTESLALGDIEAEMPFGNFTRGRFAWRLARIRPLAPFPVRGRQGLFDVSVDGLYGPSILEPLLPMLMGSST